MLTKVLHGKVHGRMIELDEDLGVAEGQEVEVRVTVVARKSGEGILRTEGALADDEEWDAVMDEVYKARKVERRLGREFLTEGARPAPGRFIPD